MRSPSFAALVCLVSTLTAAPPDVRPAAPPALTELSPAPKAPPKPAVAAADPIPVAVGTYRWFTVTNYTGPVTWELAGDGLGLREADKPVVLFGVVAGQAEPGFADVPAGAVILWGRTPGPVTLHAFGVIDGRAKRLFSQPFVVNGTGPQPPPKPTPTPPTPAPADVPIKADGLHVLIVYDAKVPLPEAQFNVIYGQKSRQMLNAKCATTAAWRIWPADADTSAEQGHWKDAYARPRKSLPWVLVSNPKVGGFEGPLPATVDEFEALIGRYAK